MENSTEDKYSETSDVDNLSIHKSKPTGQNKSKKKVKNKKNKRNLLYNSQKQSETLYTKDGIPNEAKPKTKYYKAGKKNLTIGHPKEQPRNKFNHKNILTHTSDGSDQNKVKPLTDIETVIDKLTKILPKSKNESKILLAFHVDKDNKMHDIESLEEYEKYIDETDDDFSATDDDISEKPEDENQHSLNDERPPQISNENSEHVIISNTVILTKENNADKTDQKSENSFAVESNSKIKHSTDEADKKFENDFKEKVALGTECNADKPGGNQSNPTEDDEDDFLFDPDAEEESFDEEMDYFLTEGKRNRKKTMMDKFTEKEQIEKFREELAFLPDVPTDPEDEVPYEEPEGDKLEDKESKFHYYPPAEDEMPLPEVDEVCDETDLEFEKGWFHYNEDEEKDYLLHRRRKGKLTKNEKTSSTINNNPLNIDGKQEYKKTYDWRKNKKKKSKVAEVKIVSRREWDIDFKGQMTRRHYPIGYISYQCTGTKPCRNTHECKRILKEIVAKDKESGITNIRHNFFVGGDTFIYEGKGWNTYEENSTDNYATGYGQHSISIAFIGTYFRASKPPPSMMLAAYNFVNYGIQQKNIWRNFRCSEIKYN